jgi:hypothetical protein
MLGDVTNENWKTFLYAYILQDMLRGLQYVSKILRLLGFNQHKLGFKKLVR